MVFESNWSSLTAFVLGIAVYVLVFVEKKKMLNLDNYNSFMSICQTFENWAELRSDLLQNQTKTQLSIFLTNRAVSLYKGGCCKETGTPKMYQRRRISVRDRYKKPTRDLSGLLSIPHSTNWNRLALPVRTKAVFWRVMGQNSEFRI